MPSPPPVAILGIRHHGPGSARAVGRALDRLEPAVVVIEGPPELDPVAALAGSPLMVPPVAALVYDPARPRRAAFYPMAAFSPEWVALRWALRRGVPVRFADLPAANALAPGAADDDPALPDPDSGPGRAAGDPEAAHGPRPAVDGPGSAAGDPEAAHGPRPAMDSSGPAAGDPGDGPDDGESRPADAPGPDPCLARADPIGALAAAAGYDDAERWWEDAVEQRDPGPDGLARFDAVRAAMAELRHGIDETALAGGAHTLRREAAMRRVLRAVVKQADGPVAVVCGAYHAPVLHPDAWPTQAADNARLKGLPRTPVAATWAPWTSGRLAAASGYGAGVTAPGWYQHLFATGHGGDRTGDDHGGAQGEGSDTHGEDTDGRGSDRMETRGDQADVVTRWMVRVAGLLRANGYDAPPASAVEAVRLAETLAALRARPVAGLAEVTDAAETVLAQGSPARLATIATELLVGHDLGAVPPETPMVPLAEDLARQQKAVRLKPAAEPRTLVLDLRQPAQLARSVLFRRLRILGVDWAQPANAGATGGTFKEGWLVQWHPELAVAVIEASLHGTTVASAAAARVTADAEAAPDLATLAELVERCLPADLPDALAGVVDVLSSRTALASDHLAVLGAVEPLARTRRYGDVRGVDTGVVHEVLAALVTRAAIGLAPACAALDDDAAAVMRAAVESVERGVSLVADAELGRLWYESLAALPEATVHGGVTGRVARILLDTGRIGPGEAAARLGRRLSPAAEPRQAAAWLDGFLAGDAALLLHDPAVFGLIDSWLATLDDDAFDDLLPLVRRTFARFQPAERRRIGELASRAGGATAATAADDDGWDEARALPALARMAELLGLPTSRSTPPAVPDHVPAAAPTPRPAATAGPPVVPSPGPDTATSIERTGPTA